MDEKEEILILIKRKTNSSSANGFRFGRENLIHTVFSIRNSMRISILIRTAFSGVFLHNKTQVIVELS